MKLSQILIITAIVIYALFKMFYHPQFPMEANGMVSSYKGNNLMDPAPCQGRSICVYAYMAPWCPACKQTIPLVGMMRNKWKAPDQPGLKVVIGNGTSVEQLEAMAEQVGSPVYLDKDDQFLKAIGVRHFPYFVVVDDKDNIIASGNSARSWLEKKINGR